MVNLDLASHIAEAFCTRTWGHTADGIPCSACRKEAALIAARHKCCDRVDQLRAEVQFWRQQRDFAVDVATTISGLDEEAPALRQLLRRERERRHRAEDEIVRLRWAAGERA